MTKKPPPPRSDLLRQELDALRDAINRDKAAANVIRTVSKTTHAMAKKRPPRKPR